MEELNKSSILKEEIVAQLLKARIINKEKEILDKKAFVDFIDQEIKKCDKEMYSMEEGLMNKTADYDGNRVTLLADKIEYLKRMKKHMSVTPDDGYPTTEDIKQYFKEQEVNKRKSAMRKPWFLGLFNSRNK